MNDKQLVSFITVADKGSFSRAAQTLYTTPQTLVQQMNQLEQEVGAKLLDRNQKGALLTNAGREFYRGAQKLLELTNETVEKSRSADSTQSEVIRIGMTQLKSMFMPDICLAFSARYPQIQMKMVQLASNDWQSLLCDEKVDVIESDVSNDFGGMQVETTMLIRDRRMCILSPMHPLARKDIINLNDLAAYPVYVHNLAWLQSLKSEIRAITANIRLIEKPCTIANVFESCLSGGIFLAPERLTSRFSPLVARPLHIDLKWDFGIAYLKHRNKTVNKFIEVAKEVFPR